ncbi:MAG: 50S ribosomal protein L35 [Synechococcaceae cyanobacterium RM1_1_27]|nr:50S ribosomal protein L35 [Synechococcaceae cyanobacterium SM2_3_2]NJO86294.1 50S ribosomal protein L35 [Synechococcaceae cyanobacterium RM1_1_27]
MPKLKTRRSAAKRFQFTGSGKIKFRRSGHNHLLEHKTTKRKRSLRGTALVDERDAENVRLMMPYGR